MLVLSVPFFYDLIGQKRLGSQHFWSGDEFGVQLVGQGQDFLVGGDVAHVVAVMNETRHAGFVDQYLGGHAAQFEQVDFLSVEFQDAGFWVGQADEGQGFFFEIGSKGFGIFRANHDNFYITGNEFLIILTQLRHMLLAKWSGKSAVENQ